MKKRLAAAFGIGALTGITLVGSAYAQFLSDLAAELEDGAPPKVEGGSPARQQWIRDVLAVSAAAEINRIGKFWHRSLDPAPDLEATLASGNYRPGGTSRDAAAGVALPGG